MTKTCWDALSGIIRDKEKPKVATKDFSTFHNWIILGSALSSKLKELRRTKCALPTKFAFSLSSNRGIVLKKGRTAVVEALFFCPLLTMASPRLLLFLLADTFKWKLPRFEVEDSGKEYNSVLDYINKKEPSISKPTKSTKKEPIYKNTLRYL